jgi:hypothetical protein
MGTEDDQNPNTQNRERGNSPKKNQNLLGNFAIYKVNNEFENF